MIIKIENKKLSEAIEGVYNIKDIVLGKYPSRVIAEKVACPKIYDIRKDLHKKKFRDIIFGGMGTEVDSMFVNLEDIVVLNDFGIIEQDKLTIFHGRHEINNARVLLCSYVEPVGDNSGNYNGIIRFMFNNDVKVELENYIKELQNSLLQDKKIESIGEGSGGIGGN